MLIQLFSLILIPIIWLTGMFTWQSNKPQAAETVKVDPCYTVSTKNIATSTIFASSWGVYCLNPNDYSLRRIDGVNTDQKNLIASITKLMTVYTAIDLSQRKLEKVITIKSEDIGEWTQNRYKLGEKVVLGDLIKSALVESDNDAARALANNFVMNSFIHEMNLRAADLNLNDTFFGNPTGLDGEYFGTNYSTVDDLAHLAAYLYKNYPLIYGVTQNSETSIYNESGLGHVASATDQLTIDESYKDLIIMGKTGDTDLAKKNLLLVWKNGNNVFVSIVLHSDDQFSDMKKIIDAYR